MSALAPAAMLALLVAKLTDWVKAVLPAEFTTKALVPISMGISVVLALAFGASPALAQHITIFDGLTLANADVWAQLLWGACIGAGAGVAYDVTNNKEGSDGYSGH